MTGATTTPRQFETNTVKCNDLMRVERHWLTVRNAAQIPFKGGARQSPEVPRLLFGSASRERHEEGPL